MIRIFKDANFTALHEGDAVAIYHFDPSFKGDTQKLVLVVINGYRNGYQFKESEADKFIEAAKSFNIQMGCREEQVCRKLDSDWTAAYEEAQG